MGKRRREESEAPAQPAQKKAKTSKMLPCADKCALSLSDCEGSDVEVFLIRVPVSEDISSLKDVVIPDSLLKTNGAHVDLPGGRRLVASNDIDPRQVRVVLPTGEIEAVKFAGADSDSDVSDSEEESSKSKKKTFRNAVVVPRRIAGTLRLMPAPPAPAAAAAGAAAPTPLAPSNGLAIAIQSRVVVPQISSRLKFKQAPLGSGSAGPKVVTVVSAPGTVYRSALAAPASPVADKSEKKEKKEKKDKSEKKEKKDKKDKRKDESD